MSKSLHATKWHDELVMDSLLMADKWASGIRWMYSQPGRRAVLRCAEYEVKSAHILMNAFYGKHA